MKKILILLLFILSGSVYAKSFNCKSVSSEYYDFDLKVTIENNLVNVFNNKTKLNDLCDVHFPEKGINVIVCEKIQIVITSKKMDIEGGNSMYQTSNGMRGSLDCR